MRHLSYKKKSGAALITVVLFCLAIPSCAEVLSPDNFISELTKPEVVAPFTIDSDHYSRLSAEQRQDVLSAKETLVSLFKALEEHEKDVSRFLAPDFPNRNVSAEEIRQNLASDEAAIVQLTISDVQSKNDGRAMNLEFYAVVFSDGTFELGKGLAMMTKTRDGWQISTIKID